MLVSTIVVRLSLQLSRETDGAFDITVAPLVNEWGFGFKHRERINASKIRFAPRVVGYDKLFLRRKSIEQTRFARHHRLWCGGERLRRRLRARCFLPKAAPIIWWRSEARL